MIIVDTNILADINGNDPEWGQWSLNALTRAGASKSLLINPVIYAEFSVGLPSVQSCDEELARFGFIMADIPREALFLAGRAFRDYRRRGGIRTGVLPDFFIGAHAQVIGAELLTRDAGRYETYFPEVKLVRP